jgi:hypothetical protein
MNHFFSQGGLEVKAWAFDMPTSEANPRKSILFDCDPIPDDFRNNIPHMLQ